MGSTFAGMDTSDRVLLTVLVIGAVIGVYLAGSHALHHLLSHTVAALSAVSQ